MDADYRAAAAGLPRSLPPPPAARSQPADATPSKPPLAPSPGLPPISTAPAAQPAGRRSEELLLAGGASDGGGSNGPGTPGGASSSETPVADSPAAAAGGWGAAAGGAVDGVDGSDPLGGLPRSSSGALPVSTLSGGLFGRSGSKASLASQPGSTPPSVAQQQQQTAVPVPPASPAAVEVAGPEVPQAAAVGKGPLAALGAPYTQPEVVAAIEVVVNGFELTKPTDCFFALQVGPYWAVSTTTHSTMQPTWHWVSCVWGWGGGCCLKALQELGAR
jgi:hypothetical protein